MLKLRIFDAALAVTVTFSAVLFGTLLLSPVFLQEFLGYSAWKAGLVQAPRGIGAVTSMMLVGNDCLFLYRPPSCPVLESVRNGTFR